ncbi:hypothetical protein GCM10027075_33630 [Streptomyces heilongjiangensis]
MPAGAGAYGVGGARCAGGCGWFVVSRAHAAEPYVSPPRAPEGMGLRPGPQPGSTGRGPGRFSGARGAARTTTTNPHPPTHRYRPYAFTGAIISPPSPALTRRGSAYGIDPYQSHATP